MKLFAKGLRFGCNQCGECCRQMRVPLSHADVLRLWQARAEQPLLSWLQIHPAEPDDPDAIWLNGQLSMLMLRVRHQDQGCVFLNDNACSVYAARPRACRIWPLETHRGQLRVSLPYELMVNMHCDKTPFQAKAAAQVRREIAASQAEFAEFRPLTRAWNLQVGERPEAQTLDAFIQFIQTAMEATK